MKRKKIAIVTGLVITLVGANIQGTFGLEEDRGNQAGINNEYQSQKLQESAAAVSTEQVSLQEGSITNPSDGNTGSSVSNSTVTGGGTTHSPEPDSGKAEADKGADVGDNGSGKPDTDNGHEGTGKPSTDKGEEGTGKPDADKGEEETGKPDTDKGEDGVEKPDKGEGGTENPDADKEGGTQKPDSDKDEGTQNPDADKEGDGTQNPDTDKEGDGTQNPDTDKEGDGTENPDADKEEDGTQNPDTDQEAAGKPDADKENSGSQTPDKEEEANNPEADKNESESGKPDTSTDETATEKPKDNTGGNTAINDNRADAESEKPYYEGEVINDNSADAVYSGDIYKPSDLFIDNRDKMKYNVALPIEGIPSFITQEMIIGALKCQDETGYPASVTIAQIIQESGYGTYGPGGDDGQGLSYLAYQYNNLFGIKGTGPAGSVNMRTGEQTSAGESYMTTAGFRVYNTYTECIEDRTELLKEVYSDLTEGVTDANTFAMRIGSRWATDIRYAQSLISQMQTYDLYRLDRMTLGQFSKMIGTFANPCPGASVSSNFGYREFRNSFHKGIDLGTGSLNIPTYAAEAGTVVIAGWSDSAGNWVVIDHGNGLMTKYMHHDKIYVTEGQHVEKGQQIGLSGTTGDSTGNHLHFQVEENGEAVDPALYLGLEQ